MSDRPHSERERREQREETLDRRGDPYDEDDSITASYLPFGWPAWPAYPWNDDERADSGYGYDETGDAVGEPYEETGDGSWLDEGLITLLLVAGVALFLFPEPATSGLGVFLILLGAAAWVVDWAL